MINLNKFRAWDSYHKEWAFDGEVSNSELFDYSESNAVVVVEQFSGILDKYDNPLYSGDIIRYTTSRGSYIMPISQLPGIFVATHANIVFHLHAMIKDNIEKVGNIHENFDLLIGVANDKL